MYSTVYDLTNCVSSIMQSLYMYTSVNGMLVWESPLCVHVYMFMRSDPFSTEANPLYNGKK